MAETRLTDDEREALAKACYEMKYLRRTSAMSTWSGLAGFQRDQQRSHTVEAAVEAILAARLARVEALADQWNDTPDYTPTDYDQGRVDQRHDMTMQLLVALAPAQPVSEPSDG